MRISITESPTGLIVSRRARDPASNKATTPLDAAKIGFVLVNNEIARAFAKCRVPAPFARIQM